MKTYKQVIVWRHDLKVRLGKKMAQAAHAARTGIDRQITESLCSGESVVKIEISPAMAAWLSGDYRKIVLRVNSEEELKQIHEKALEAGLDSHLVTDSGLTEFGGVPTVTCCAIGPDDSEKIDEITGHLSIL